MKAGFEEGLSRRMVGEIGRDDRDSVYAIGSCLLACHHFLEIGVCAIWSNSHRSGARPGTVRIGRHRSGHQLVTIVKPRSHAVDAADEGAGSTAHHAKAQPPPQSRCSCP